jgi:hypothetical protein
MTSSTSQAHRRFLPSVLLLLAACGGTQMTIPQAPDAPQASFASVTPEQWRALAAKRMFFGHQSVGANIMEGVKAVLAEHADIPLQVFESSTLDSTSPPGLYQARIGHNGDPASKLAAFDTIVGRGAPSIGVLKFCFVDVEGGRNPDSLFAAYQSDITALRARMPGLVIMHVTMPLTTTGEGRRDLLMAKLKGRLTSYDLNLIRNRYNALLREAYVGKEPVFDLARLESTRADGSRSYFVRGSDTVYTLANEWTDDGSHLNTVARRAAAEAFLATLATP